MLLLLILLLLDPREVTAQAFPSIPRGCFLPDCYRGLITFLWLLLHRAPAPLSSLALVCVSPIGGELTMCGAGPGTVMSIPKTPAGMSLSHSACACNTGLATTLAVFLSSYGVTARAQTLG